MPPTFDPPPTPWDADDRSLFAPASFAPRGFFARWLSRLLWRRRWTP